MNTIGVKLHKIHILHIKKQYVNQWQKNKKENWNKKELKKPKKLKIQRMKLQTYLISKNVKHMRKIERIIYLSINNSFILPKLKKC